MKQATFPRTLVFATALALVGFAPLAQAAGANDSWANATRVTTDVTNPATLVDTNIGATLEPGEQQPCGGIGSTIWFAFSTTLWGSSVVVDTQGSDFDTVLAVYENDPTTNPPLDCNDDYNGFHSRIAFAPLPYTTYYVQAGGFVGRQGNLQITFASSGGGPAPPNPTVRGNPDGTCTVYDDRNFNGLEDAGEHMVTIPCSASNTNPNVQVRQNPNGTCTLYNDRNANGAVDAGEEIATVPCGAGDVPVNVPPQSLTHTIPSLSTPNVPPTTLTTPPVVAPAACTVTVCTAPTVVPGQSTPPIPLTCVPILCVGPVPPQPLTPPVTVPPLCTLASAVCLPPTTLVPAQTVTVPGQPPITLTPAITVSVTSTGFTGLIEPNVGELATLGPLTVHVGPVPVTLCPSTCPVPVPPDASLAGSITVTVAVGATTFSQTIPISL